MIDAVVDEALSDLELEQLANRLAAIHHEDALSLEAVDGLFCALIASPTMVPPSVYMPVILGSGSSTSEVFVDAQDATVTLAFLMRLWNDIVRDFNSDEPVHMPYIEEPGTDNVPGRAWARGFLKGTRLAPEGWGRLFQDENEGYALVIPAVAGELDPQWPQESLNREKSDELLKSMSAAAARAYRFFDTDRRRVSLHAHDSATPFIRKDVKIGRNDACPCGSGRKFKKCCKYYTIFRATGAMSITS